MGRRKVKLAPIVDENARRTTFNKRKSSLVKKARELSTLCGIEGCLIIYSPADSYSHPIVWPTLSESRRVVERFRNLSPKNQSKNMICKEGFASRSLQDLVKKLESERNKNDNFVLKGLINLNGNIFKDPGELEEIGCFLNKEIETMNERIDLLRRENFAHSVSSSTED